MRAVVQRVSSASVRVAGEVVGAIDHGALILLGVLEGDGEREALQLASKIASHRAVGSTHGSHIARRFVCSDINTRPQAQASALIRR